MLQTATATARELNATYVYNCHSTCKQKEDGCTDAVAAFLIGAGEYHYFGLGAWEDENGDFSGHWIDGLFNRPLGAPVGEATYNTSSGVWRRAFATGTVVLFNTTSNTGSIAWSG